MPLRPALKLQGRQLHYSVFLWTVGNVNALIDGKAGNARQLMVHVRPQRANAVWGEGNRLRRTFVYFFKN